MGKGGRRAKRLRKITYHPSECLSNARRPSSHERITEKSALDFDRTSAGDRRSTTHVYAGIVRRRGDRDCEERGARDFATP